MLKFIIGFILGEFVGVIIMALLIASKDKEERMKTRDGKEIEIYDVELNSTFEVEGNKIFVLYWNSNIGFGEMTFIKKDNEDGESIYEVETECMATNEHKEFIKLVLDKFIEKLNVIE